VCTENLDSEVMVMKSTEDRIRIDDSDGAIRRAGALFQNKPAWRTMQTNGMTVDVSWRNPARHYADLYRQVAKLNSTKQ